MSKDLRPYQIDVQHAARRHIAAGRRKGLIVIPTGGGKTHVSSAMLEQTYAKGMEAIFIAHRRRLIEQKSDRLTLFGVPHGIIMDDLSPRYAHLRRPQERIQVVSRDTVLSRCVRNQWQALPPARLVIVDEAHNWMSDECQKLLACYADAIVIGLTATPCRSDGRGLGDYFEFLCQSVPTSQLVRDGHLVPVKCYHPDTSNERDEKGLRGDPVSHWKRFADGKRTVFFAAKVKTSLAAMNQFVQAGIPAVHIDANTPDEERDRIIDDVKAGKILVVCNVGIWTEGVDIPELEVCQFWRGCESYVLYAQGCGRIMRPSPGKTHGIIIDHAGAVDRHGFPDEDVEWSLDTTDSVECRIKQDKDDGKRKKPITCPSCYAVFSGAMTCPECGHVLKRTGKAEVKTDELLVEAERRHRERASYDEMTRFWKKTLGQGAHLGWTLGRAATIFKQRFGDWPEHLGIQVPPHSKQWLMKVCEVFPEYVRRKAVGDAA